MIEMRFVRRALAAIAALALIAAVSPRTAYGQVQQGVLGNNPGAATIAGMASQLGLKIVPSGESELSLGGSFTGLLEDPAKLESVGVHGMHEGARVCVIKVGPDRVRVEADELEPKPAKATVTLTITSKGELVPAGKK